MIIRLSGKLGKKLKVAPREVLPMDANPYADWSAHLFLADKKQYILIVEATVIHGWLRRCGPQH